MEDESHTQSVETRVLPASEQAAIRRQNKQRIQSAWMNTLEGFPVCYMAIIERMEIYHTSNHQTDDMPRVEIYYAGVYDTLPYNACTCALQPGYVVEIIVDRSSLQVNDWTTKVILVYPYDAANLGNKDLMDPLSFSSSDPT